MVLHISDVFVWYFCFSLLILVVVADGDGDGDGDGGSDCYRSGRWWLVAVGVGASVIS